MEAMGRMMGMMKMMQECNEMMTFRPAPRRERQRNPEVIGMFRQGLLHPCLGSSVIFMERWIAGFFVTAMIIAALVFYTLEGGFCQKGQTAVDAVGSNVKKLGIEILEKKTAAPDFTLKEPAGTQIALKELRGRVVFLNFWATWCPPCIEEMPAMERLHQELQKDGLVILAVNFQEGPERVKEFFAKHKFTFTPLLDRDGKVSELYQAWALPVSAIINKRGEVAARAIGSKDWHNAEAREFFKQLLTEEPSG